MKLLLPRLVSAVAEVDARRAAFLGEQMCKRHALASPLDEDLDLRSLHALVGLGVLRILALIPGRGRQILTAPRAEGIERQADVMVADGTDEQRPQLRAPALPDDGVVPL